MNASWLVRSVAAVTAIVSLAMGCTEAEQRGPTVRPAYWADRYYPGDREALRKQVDEFLARASPPEIAGKPLAIISPHAGYMYSGLVAATGYRCLQGHTYKRVIALGFSHTVSHEGVNVPKELTAYATPLGEVPIDREVCDRLLEKPVFSARPDVDRGEKSVEVQLPFLQRVLKDFRLVPLLVGRMADRDYAEAARAILPLIDDDTLLVASSDFTHFGPNFLYQPFKDDLPNKLGELAKQAAAPLVRCDYDGFVEHLAKTRDTICGRGPITLLLRILSMQGGARGLRAAYDTSGRMTGDWTSSVTYQSFVFTRRPGTLGKQERAALLGIARRAVAAFLKTRQPVEVDAEKLPAALRKDGACFVTLENRDRLRGCIGNMVADGPLYQSVIRNAVSACQDSRFVDNPVTAEELDQLHIEISCLTPKSMKRVASPAEIIVGRHGVVIGLGRRRGLLLPQIAYRRGWTRAEFLAQTCRKAGLPLDAWKRPEAEIYSFEAEVFGEPE